MTNDGRRDAETPWRQGTGGTNAKGTETSVVLQKCQGGCLITPPGAAASTRRLRHDSPQGELQHACPIAGATGEALTYLHADSGRTFTTQERNFFWPLELTLFCKGKNTVLEGGFCLFPRPQSRCEKGD